MAEIEIRIRVDQQEESIYRFSKFPIEVGRSETCDLSIRHESIPRKLCRIWLEPSGLIHAEEYPELTNPLVESGKIVHNGVCKPQLTLTIGPVKFRVHNLSNSSGSWKPRRSHRASIIFVAISAIAVLLSLLWYRQAGAFSHYNAILTDFPRILPLQQPWHPTGAQQKTDIPAKVLVQLAQTEYMRRPEDVQRKKHAIALIWRAETQSAPSSKLYKRAHSLRVKWEKELQTTYRLQIVALVNALKNDEPETIQRTAQRLLQYLDGADPKLYAWLQQLETNGEAQ